jgi:alkanesulfonate monooxygenase SsuD/methylene tetrahydromethanopterin reductase-like flavin-dependent oxidoreductase (luciferase family)
VPGVFSAETIKWAAQHRYPYIALNTPLHIADQIWDTYDVAARQVGYEAGPENRGYLLRVHVQDTEEKALENARQFMWMQGEFTGIGHPYWLNPPGYSSPSRRLFFAKLANAGTKQALERSLESQLDTLEIVAGNPTQVIEKLRVVLERCRPSILMLFANDGKIDHANSLRCIELMGREVLPAVRQIGDELGLHDPFQLDAPISLQFTPADQLRPQGELEDAPDPFGAIAGAASPSRPA